MKIRKCRICNSYTLKLKHCGVPTDKANPPNFKIRLLQATISPLS